mgnify:CR=1 FL=1
MSNSLRFLGFAVLAWAGVRAASLAFAPGMTVPPASAAKAATLPPVAVTRFDPPPPPDPVAVAMPAYPGMAGPYGAAWPGPYSAAQYYPPPAHYPRGDRTIVIPASWPTERQSRRSGRDGWDLVSPTPQPLYYVPMGEQPWPTGPGASTPPMRSTGERSAPLVTPPLAPARFDRLQLTAWALLRGTGKGIIPTPSLASGGTLGASQAGARLTWRFNQAWAASIRTSSSVGGVRGAEVAGGIRWQPLRSVPVAITAERREGLGRFGGRSAFALFAEGGLYNRALFNKIYLDAYLQGGVVGLRNRDLFIDGGATLTRPIWRNISGGIGVWGAAQPGLYRLDAGPRITMQVRRGIKVHADYRQRLLGNAAPPSGPAVTLAADF